MTWKSWTRGLLLGLGLVAATATAGGAQSLTGTITGRAADSSGGLLPGVTVTITSPQMIGGARDAVTDDQGVYRFTLLPGGTYVVSFSLPGFSTLNVRASR
ncbi:MAG: carboxypeptidase-like regulatory domain-containing protein [Vicinamibacterales bacterium]